MRDQLLMTAIRARSALFNNITRVVKADIVNYSQESVARTVNPPRSSMCIIQ